MGEDQFDKMQVGGHAAAAVAGLMLEASPDMSPASVNQVLMASAIDIDALDAFKTVTDSGTGCIPMLYLFDQVITGSQYFRACDEITVDAYARAHNEYEISLQNINRAWLVLFKMKEVVEEPANAWVTFPASKLTPHSLVCGYVDLNTELVGPPPDFTDCIKSALRRDEVRPVQTVARASRSGIHFCQ